MAERGQTSLHAGISDLMLNRAASRGTEAIPVWPNVQEEQVEQLDSTAVRSPRAATETQRSQK